MRINQGFFLISAILTFRYKNVLPSAVELSMIKELVTLLFSQICQAIYRRHLRS